VKNRSVNEGGNHMQNYYQESQYWNPADTQGVQLRKLALKTVKTNFNRLNGTGKRLLINVIHLFEQNHYRPITRHSLAGKLKKNRLGSNDIRLLDLFVELKILQSYRISNQAINGGSGHCIEYRMTPDNAYLFYLLFQVIRKSGSKQATPPGA